MHHRRLAVVLAAVAVSVGVVHGGQVRDLPEITMVERVGQSALLQAGDVRILVLQGSPYQMGYAHGRLLAKDVRTVVDRIITVAQAADAKQRGDLFAGTLEEIHRRTLPYVPARYREEVAGLADGAGLDRRKVAWTNIFPELFHCSGFAMMGQATTGGKLVHGRILDYMVGVGLQDHAVVVVARPTGANAIMLASYTGFIGCVTGMNDKQLGIGEMGMPGGVGDWDGVPMAYMLRQVLEECDTLEQGLKLMRRASRTCEYAYVLSDAKIPSAVAVHAQVKALNTLGPGQPYALLPDPVEDCVLVSSGGRYETLVERTRQYFGKIDVRAMVEIIKQPVAMDGNLHNAIMIPQDGTMYLANAGGPGDERFQACYQPYYRYDLKRFVKILDDLAGKHEPTQPVHIPLGSKVETATQPAAKPVLQAVTGTVSETSYRPIAPATDVRVGELLKAYAGRAEAFDWEMKPLNVAEHYTFWQVTFPSPYPSPDPENNTVWCEYFKSNKSGPRPAVIVLHILQNDFTLPRVIGNALAVNGIDALLVKMAYYGPRRPKDPERQKTLMRDIDSLRVGVRQSVMDIRRAARFLAEQKDIDPKRIGICGVSLGALVGSLTIGVDGNFPKAALVLGGGDLTSMFMAKSREVHELTKYITKNNIDEPTLRTMLEPIEPLTFASRAANTEVLMINARGDEVIPSVCAKKLAAALPKSRTIWYDADHEKMVWHLMDALTRIQTFFAE